jgi:hypothetical protein
VKYEKLVAALDKFIQRVNSTLETDVQDFRKRVESYGFSVFGALETVAMPKR